ARRGRGAGHDWAARGRRREPHPGAVPGRGRSPLRRRVGRRGAPDRGRRARGPAGRRGGARRDAGGSRAACGRPDDAWQRSVAGAGRPRTWVRVRRPGETGRWQPLGNGGVRALAAHGFGASKRGTLSRMPAIGSLEKPLRFGEGRRMKRLAEQAAYIATLEPDFQGLTDAGLRAKPDDYRARLADGETLEDILFEAFAAVRES